MLHLVQPQIFGEDNLIGNDYSYFFPYLLSGYYWFLNNGLNAPWFTPALCAGIPHFANPQSAYYSLPQFLLILVDPGTSLVLTYYIAGIIGFSGAWMLATRVTHHPLVLLFASCSFMLNGFVLARYQAGHLSFHAYMLLPGICYLLLLQVRTVGQSQGIVIITGLLLSYLVHSGAGVIIVPFGVALVLVLVIFTAGMIVWVRLVLAGLLGIALSASKLVATWYFLKEFPRDLYLLPAYENFLTSILATMRSLIWTMPTIDANAIIVNKSFLIGPEELDYRVPISFFISLGGIFILRQITVSRIRLAVIILLLSSPILLNSYQVDWQGMLKMLPYFGTASSLFRWNLIYILPIILLSVKVLDHLTNRSRIGGNLFAVIGILAVLAMPFISNYSSLPRGYDSTAIDSAYWNARLTGDIPTVLKLEESLVNGKRLSIVGSGDALIRGASQIVCNEPLFGYRLESFRFDQVFRGDVFARHGGAFNFYKPECLIYPAENTCQPGDRFRPDESEALTSFISWQPYDFNIPVVQSIANVVNGSALIMLLLFSLYRAFDSIRRRGL